MEFVDHAGVLISKGSNSMMSAGTRHTLTSRTRLIEREDRCSDQRSRSTTSRVAETPDQEFLCAFDCGVRHGHIVFVPVEADGTGSLAGHRMRRKACASPAQFSLTVCE